MVENPTDDVSKWRLYAGKHPVVDFAVTDNSSAPNVFEISEVAYCEPKDGLDIAILRLKSGNVAVPPALTLDFGVESAGRTIGEGAARQFQGAEIYVVGHPYRVWSSTDTRSVFGVADGKKRWSPGMVVSMIAGTALLRHDCSTLEGNSGSCVVSSGFHKVIGLHMAGLNVSANTGRGSGNAALSFSLLGNRKIAQLLRIGMVTSVE
jgi:hypothetical protein